MVVISGASRWLDAPANNGASIKDAPQTAPRQALVILAIAPVFI
jgi:hypothetical protein